MRSLIYYGASPKEIMKCLVSYYPHYYPWDLSQKHTPTRSIEHTPSPRLRFKSTIIGYGSTDTGVGAEGSRDSGLVFPDTTLMQTIRSGDGCPGTTPAEDVLNTGSPGTGSVARAGASAPKKNFRKFPLRVQIAGPWGIIGT